MEITNFGQWAMVAGSAEGLGAAFSRSLARRGLNLILVDQNESALESLKKDLCRVFNIRVETIITDLAKSDSPSLLRDVMEQHDCGLLIYNAAFGPVRLFKDLSEKDIDTTINVNLGTPTRLIQMWLEGRQDKKTGVILLSSLAGFRGTRLVVPYAATKAYLWNFTEGLHYEYQNKPYTFAVCCPGAIGTPNYLGTKPRPFWLAPIPSKPSDVAEYTLRKFGGQLFIMPGRMNRISHFFMSYILPRSWASGLHNYVMRKLYEA
ncbi:SDR family NAD(P)-dependent oxidoreductase [Fulvivirga sedimenti]|uniref:SDR family NAD(P)-dependent oxidoreductase n=1 Tax=Fulvivirga sedimenti TaxID=2879465 RepID=A0A9X1KXJ8_9BACT|nr:SDR family NAD(P)-dependent oxidoreductase [Fulvivirga sedimenti]MCA6075855.1 SDR family NAD(P)-dependent oxidoreductase [Fulvivirga sedimenti]MCA6076983.1 SDR family NAD(P)-dependent oxidoreductase [Fulvivirga sedimenti]